MKFSLLVRLPSDVDENDIKYDVFVTYSRNDFPWVDGELLRLLCENQVNYCVDHVHFELGKAIVENIAERVYQNRKVSAVSSGSYASSKYCKQELDYAIQGHTAQRSEQLLLSDLTGRTGNSCPNHYEQQHFLITLTAWRGKDGKNGS